METSLFGLGTGSYMVNYGGTNTAYAAPSILAQTGGYTSSRFPRKYWILLESQ